MKIDDIVIGTRFRKSLGDLDGLAASIRDRGLLHPPVVTTDRQLVCGFRRLKACERLGWDDMPVRVVDPDDLVMAEHDENECREDFAPSERVAIAREIERRIGNRRGERTDRMNFVPMGTKLAGQRTDDVAAKAAGFKSRGEYHRVSYVVDHGVPELVEALDAGDVSASAAAEVAKLPKAEQKKVVKGGAAKVKETAKEKRAERKKPAKKAADPPAEDAESPHAEQSNASPQPCADEQAADEVPPPKAPKVAPPPETDKWDLPIQEHARAAFDLQPRYKALLARLKDFAADLSALVEDTPSGGHAIKQMQWRERANGGRWHVSHLDNLMAFMEAITPTVTDCPYAFNSDAPHPEKCTLCHNLRWLGGLKGYQIPPSLTAAMKSHYGITEDA